MRFDVWMRAELSRSGRCTRQPAWAGMGYARVGKSLPVPVPGPTRTCNPHGLVNPCQSLIVSETQPCSHLGSHFVLTNHIMAYDYCPGTKLFLILLLEEMEGSRRRTLPHNIYFCQNLLPDIFESESHVAAWFREINVGFVHPLTKSSHNLFKFDII